MAILRAMETDKSAGGEPRSDPVSTMGSLLMLDEMPAPNNDCALAASQYIDSFPGKKTLSKTMDAFNKWFHVPEPTMDIIKRMAEILHNATILLDDVEDGSALRRGRPVAHKVYGEAPTVNAGGHKINESLLEILKLRCPTSTQIYAEELGRLYEGQAHDLYSTYSLTCPSFVEYVRLVDDKTGSSFRMIVRLMHQHATLPNAPSCTKLATLLGRQEQLHNDYVNLMDEEFHKQKGFCDDLDEGKYSLFLIHALDNLPPFQKGQLSNLLIKRRIEGCLDVEYKRMILGLLQEAGSFAFVKNVMQDLAVGVRREIDSIEEASGTENSVIKGMVRSV